MKKIIQFNLSVCLIVFYSFSANARTGISKPISDNMIGINPLQIVNNHIGIGVYYERNLVSNGKLSATLPIQYGMEMIDNYNRFNNEISKTRTALFINPGLKYYPFGIKRFFTYALGMSLFTHFGNVSSVYYNDQNYMAYYSKEGIQFVAAGTLVNNYLNFKINRVVSFGLELGLGITYLNNYKIKSTDLLVKSGASVFPNIAFQLGFRI